MSRGQSAMVWVCAGAVAVAGHLALMQQGLAAYGAASLAPPPKPAPVVEILAVASSIAGEVRKVETPAAVRPETLTAQTNAARVTAQAVGASASVAPVQKVQSTAVAALAATIAPPAQQASSVTPARPAAATASTVRSTASVVAQPSAQVAGLSPPRMAPVAVAPVSTVTSTRPSPTASVAAPAPSVGAARVAAVTTPPVIAPEPVKPDVISSVAERAPLPPPEVQERAGIAAPTPETAPQENVETYQSVLDVLAELPKASCFAALPTLSETSAFQLEVFARTDADLGRFADDLAAGIGQTPNTTMRAISDAQCATASFITEGPAYPRFKLYFDIAQRDIKSGEALEGRIGNTGGGFISFLVIDDEGLVQDLSSFLQFSQGQARFRIPLSLTGSPVVTQQLLMALSTPSLPQTVLALNGAAAKDFFPALAAELREKGQSEDVALIAFSVE